MAEPGPSSREAPAPTAATPGLAWLGAACAAALIELGLAAWAWIAAAQGTCPEVPGWSCAALLRPRLGALGPSHLSDLALLGAVLTCLACLACAVSLAGGLSWLGAGAWRRPAAALPGLGAGIAVGAQVLSLGATGTLCPICALVAAAALSVAGLCALGLPAAERRALLCAAALACLLALPAGLSRGLYLRRDDARRRAAIGELQPQAGAPRLILVAREGCAFCEALELDVLADPSSRALLERSGGLQKVPEGHELALRHAGGPGAPVLLVISSAGEPLGRLRGLRPLREVQDFLRERLPPP